MTLRGWVFCLCLASGVAGAQAPDNPVPSTPEAMFERIDRDGGGWIDPEELRNAMMQRFARLDADGDGVLTGDEVPVHSAVLADVPDVHRVTREDFNDALPRVIARIDSDRNGVLSLDEFRAARAAAERTPPPSPQQTPTEQTP